MSKSSNDLASIRRLHHLKYLNSKYKDSIVVSKYEYAGRKITKAIKKYFFKTPINMSSKEWEAIPPLFRVRLLFDHNNFLPAEPINPPKLNLVEEKNHKPIDNLVMSEYSHNLEDVERAIIDQTIKETKNDDFSDEEIFEQIIMSQIMEDMKSEIKSEEKIPPISLAPMVFGFDLREIIAQLDEPVYFHDCVFFLSAQQKKYIQNSYNKVNPESDTGHRFLQDIKYFTSMSKDMARKKKFLY
jgi:hypothetical protein